MEQDSGNIRDRLISQLPQSGNLAAYRESVESTLAKNDRRLRLESWVAMAYWLFAVGLFTYCVLHNQYWLNTPRGHVAAFTTIMLLICGAVMVLKNMVNRSRVELLKEVKQLQLQMLELRAAMEKGGEQKTS